MLTVATADGDDTNELSTPTTTRRSSRRTLSDEDLPPRKSRNGKIHDPHEDAEDERSEFDDEHDDDKSEKGNSNPSIRRARVTRLSDQVEVDPEDDEDIPLGGKVAKKNIIMHDDQSVSSSDQAITRRSSRSARSKSMKDASSSDDDDEKLKTAGT